MPVCVGRYLSKQHAWGPQRRSAHGTIDINSMCNNDHNNNNGTNAIIFKVFVTTMTMIILLVVSLVILVMVWYSYWPSAALRSLRPRRQPARGCKRMDVIQYHSIYIYI